MSKEIINERQGTHGSFAENARISQTLKYMFKSQVVLTDVQRESLDLIATKISRILSGHPNFKDHWDDISGYALLVSKSLEKKDGKAT